MADRIFVLGEDGALHEMEEAPYPSEEHLQELLARYPNLIPGDGIDPQSPRRWLLISREAGVPKEELGGAHWSLDHLFVDQDGVPTLVEVKRSEDTRIRREVVGQMLDYAANGVAYWPVERLQALFEATCRETGSDALEVLDSFLDGGTEDFWKSVKTNLQAGRIRMVFVADRIPAPLQRVVEFLNGQMDPAEVLAVEVSRFSGSGLETLAPRLIGQNEETRAKKSGSRGAAATRHWDRESFLAELARRASPDHAEVARRIMDRCARIGLREGYGAGAVDGSYFPLVVAGDEEYKPFYLYTYGSLELQFAHLRARPAFADEEVRHEILQAMNRIDDVELPADSMSRRPSVPLTAFDTDEALDQLFAVVRLFQDRAREAADG